MEHARQVIFPLLVRGTHLRALFGDEVADVPTHADVTVCSDGALMVAMPGQAVVTAKVRLSEQQLVALHARLRLLGAPASD